jgi:hypothetical protein
MRSNDQGVEVSHSEELLLRSWELLGAFSERAVETLIITVTKLWLGRLILGLVLCCCQIFKKPLLSKKTFVELLPTVLKHLSLSYKTNLRPICSS